MQHRNDTVEIRSYIPDWSRKDSEELIVLYLQDYYATLDEEYLREALQIAKDDGLDFDALMRQVRHQLS